MTAYRSSSQTRLVRVRGFISRNHLKNPDHMYTYGSSPSFVGSPHMSVCVYCRRFNSQKSAGVSFFNKVNTTKSPPPVKSLISKRVPSSVDNFTRLFNLLSSQTGEVSDAAEKKIGEFFPLAIHDEQGFAHPGVVPLLTQNDTGHCAVFRSAG